MLLKKKKKKMLNQIALRRGRNVNVIKGVGGKV